MARKEPTRGKGRRAYGSPPPLAVRQPSVVKPPTRFGPPFVVLEDTTGKTFFYELGAWKPHDMTIAACRETCQVKLLPQKVNGMSRYEVRRPVA